MCLLTIVTISFSNASEAFDIVYFLLGLILYSFHDITASYILKSTSVVIFVSLPSLAIDAALIPAALFRVFLFTELIS